MPKRTESRDSDIRTPACVAALSTTAKRWKQPRCPSKNEQKNKTWCCHTLDYYSASKRKEILTRATAGMNPEDTRRGEVPDTERQVTRTIPTARGTANTGTRRRTRQTAPARGWGCGAGRALLSMDTQPQFGKMEKVLARDGGDAGKPCEYT